MSITLAVGTKVAIASAYATALPFTGISNATETVLTMASTAGLAPNDIVLVSSGWGLLDARLVKVKAVAANASVTLQQIDTSDLIRFPGGPGGGAGAVRKITAWQDITQLTPNMRVTGGEQQFAQVPTLDDRNQRQIPTTRNAGGLQLQAYYDATLAWVPIVKAISDASTTAGLRLVYPNSGFTVANCYWSLSDVATIEDSTLRQDLTLAFAALPMTYAS